METINLSTEKRSVHRVKKDHEKLNKKNIRLQIMILDSGERMVLHVLVEQKNCQDQFGDSDDCYKTINGVMQGSGHPPKKSFWKCKKERPIPIDVAMEESNHRVWTY